LLRRQHGRVARATNGHSESAGFAPAARFVITLGMTVPRRLTATLAILAGGEGSRMGRPKGELRVGGRPILQYLLDRWRWDGPTLLVTAPGRERPPGCERFDREVTDPTAGEGPLRGVITALEATTTELLLVASCDMPGLTTRQFTWLADELESDQSAPLVMLARGAGAIEPLPFAIRTTALSAVRTHLAAGGRSLHALAKLEGARTVTVPNDWPASVWTNLNTPVDLEAFLKGKAPPWS
jgi:molybdopterin-guanine dinucleotide biosynthesis protein A